MILKLRNWALALAVMVFGAGCGHHSSSSTSTSYIRLVNLTTASDLALTATASSSTTTGTMVNSGITSGGNGSYHSLTSGTYYLVTSSAGGSLAASSSTSKTMSADVYYTVVAYAHNGSIQNLLLTDNQTTPSSGYSLLTVAHEATDAGSVDVYLVPHGADISSYSPTFSSVATSSSSLSQTVNAGTYDIIVTAASKPEDVRLTMSSVTLSSQEMATFVITGTSGGALVNGALVDKGGSVTTLQQADKARVRIVGGFGNDRSSVSVSLSDSTTLDPLTSPSIGLYTLVSAGATVSSMDIVGGTSITAPTTIFASGGDYTLLVYGTAASPSVTVLTDNNQAPSSTSLAKLRLVNATVATSYGGISLTDNFVQVVSNLGLGLASDYQGVSTGQSSLVISSPWATFSPYTISTTTGSNSSLPYIYAGGVYTVFALQADPQVIVLSKDR
jgi:hypothetical protein